MKELKQYSDEILEAMLADSKRAAYLMEGPTSNIVMVGRTKFGGDVEEILMYEEGFSSLVRDGFIRHLREGTYVVTSKAMEWRDDRLDSSDS